MAKTNIPPSSVRFKRKSKQEKRVGEEGDYQTKRRLMSSTSPAHSSVSTTAIAGGGGGGGGSNAAAEDFLIPSDLISIQDRKEEALQALKSDVMAALNKEVKSLDEDSWMFDGPRSRIHLISRPATFMNKKIEMAKHTWNGLSK